MVGVQRSRSSSTDPTKSDFRAIFLDVKIQTRLLSRQTGNGCWWGVTTDTKISLNRSLLFDLNPPLYFCTIQTILRLERSQPPKSIKYLQPKTVFHKDRRQSFVHSRFLVFLSSLNFINCFRNGAGSVEIAKRCRCPPLSPVDGIVLETISQPFLNLGWREKPDRLIKEVWWEI